MKKNNSSKAFVHKFSDVQSKNIGSGTKVWQFCVILPDAVIGEDCNICSHCFIENDVIVGNRVTVKCFTDLCDGIEIEDDVFIGPHISILNDRRPRSKNYNYKYEKIVIKQGASIGAKAVILPGIKIGRNSMVGAGSILTTDVPERALVVGNPAKIIGWFNEDGSKMLKLKDNLYEDCEQKTWIQHNNRLTLKN